jgi:hypothetical protein
MKPIWLPLLFGLLGCVAAPAADFATEMLDSTFKLFNPASTATCLLVHREAPDHAVYLVTAAHVLEHANGDSVILVLRERRADGSYQRHDHTLPLRREGKPLWVRHATEDTAVLRLSEPLPFPVSSLPLSALANETRLTTAGLDICSPVFVFTYPTRFEANDAGFPVARHAIIASHPLLPIRRYPTFLADFTTFDGDSGGPVFVRDDHGHPLLIGIVLAQFRHDEQVTLEYEERMIHHPLGLGTVLHAQFITEAIEQAAK